MFIPEYVENITTCCKSCGENRLYTGWCQRDKHIKNEIVFLPFLINNAEILDLAKNITFVDKDTKKIYTLSKNEFYKICQGPGILPGGIIKDQWWICKPDYYSSTIQWLGSLDGNYGK